MKLMACVGQYSTQRPQKEHCSAKYCQIMEAESLISNVIADGEQNVTTSLATSAQAGIMLQRPPVTIRKRYRVSRQRVRDFLQNSGK